MLAGKYTADAATLATLARKVIAGGSKVWGEAAMPPHPGMSPAEAAAIIQYMLSVNDRRVSVLPLQGRYTPPTPEGELDRWKLVLRAAYTDQPVRGLPSQTTAVVKVLRAPVLSPALADVYGNVTFGSRTSGAGQASRDTAITAMNNGYVGFRRIDMTGIRRLQLATTMGGGMGAIGGAIEVRLGSTTGQLIGQASVVPPPPQGRGARGQNAGAASPAAGTGPGGGVNINLATSTGLQDVFLVFKNERARGIEPLVSVLSIRFASN
jgi:cytochrome c